MINAIDFFPILRKSLIAKPVPHPTAPSKTQGFDLYGMDFAPDFAWHVSCILNLRDTAGIDLAWDTMW